MKEIKNFDKVQAVTEREMIPVGGYVCEIKLATEKTFSGSNGEYTKLEILFDVSDGEFKEFYTNDYRNQSGEDKKWRGKILLNIPTDDGSERDEWSKRTFKGFTNSVEDSNKNYSWDWDETKLKGKKIGVLVRNQEWEYNGKSGWSTRPFKFIDVETVKNGKFKTPADKPLNDSKKSNTSIMNSPDISVDIDDGDLPF